MISFEKFIIEDGSPIYQQILLHIKRGIVAGTVVDGDELPSRRFLSALLGVNPNTVQKAYKMLEDEELILSHSGAKSCMLLDQEKTEKVRAELINSDASDIVKKLRVMGITKEEALMLVENFWDMD